MSDFDDVLERLLSDPAFKDRLAADPASALAGYRLTPDELDILQAQVGGDGAGQSRVEQRTSKASMFGLFSSIGSGIEDVVRGHGGHGFGEAVAGAGHHALDQQAGGRHAALEPQGSGGVGRQLSDLGHHSAGLEQAQSQSGFSESHTEYTSSSHTTVYTSSTYQAGGTTPRAPEDANGLAGLVGQSGVAPESGRHGIGDLVGRDVHAPTDGYHTRVDWDGDGHWDKHTYVERPDGGVDIVVDANSDGRPEFIGHDINRDGIIDSADVDFNHDGVMDAHFVDTNGDGWLDKRTK